MTDRSLPNSATGPLAIPAAGRERTVQLLYQRRSQEMFGFARRLGLADEEASDALVKYELGRDAAIGTADDNRVGIGRRERCCQPGRIGRPGDFA